MPYKPVDLSNFKIDAKLASILKLGQQEYQAITNVDFIAKKEPIEKEDKKDKRVSDIVFDFLFEPKYDNMLSIFSRRKA